MTISSALRPPLQARSRRTLARIVEASRALIEERGRDGLTVQDVVARGRTSVGSFYARFSGKEDLLRHLDEELTASAVQRWDADLSIRVSADAPLGARVKAVLGLLVAADHPPMAALDAHRRASVSALLLERRREIRGRDPETAVELGYLAVLGAARERPTGWSDARIVEELARLWLAYLHDRGDESSEGKQGVDYFQVWT